MVNDAFGMCKGHRVSKRFQEPEALPWRVRALLFDEFAEFLALDEISHKKKEIFVHHEIMYRRNAGMIQHGAGLRLVMKDAHHKRFVSKFGVEHFERHRLAKVRISRSECSGDTASADLFMNPVFSK